MNVNDFRKIIKQIPSEIYGLKWQPSVEPEISNDTDWIAPEPMPEGHFSPLNHKILEQTLLENRPRVIVEIGVDRSEDNTSTTSTILRIKPDASTYIGIDLLPKTKLNNSNKNIYTLQQDSSDRQKLYDFMSTVNLKEIDFLLVDGYHSVNQVLKEWLYWEKMSKNGVMFFHDTNFHPGPVAILDAADPSIFSVECYGRDVLDWGVGVVRRY